MARGAGGVAGAERLVGECKFHSLGKCTMVLTNMHIASSGLCISCMNVHLCGCINMTSLDSTKPNIYNCSCALMHLWP